MEASQVLLRRESGSETFRFIFFSSEQKVGEEWLRRHHGYHQLLDFHGSNLQSECYLTHKGEDMHAASHGRKLGQNHKEELAQGCHYFAFEYQVNCNSMNLQEKVC